MWFWFRGSSWFHLPRLSCVCRGPVDVLVSWTRGRSGLVGTLTLPDRAPHHPPDTVVARCPSGRPTLQFPAPELVFMGFVVDQPFVIFVPFVVRVRDLRGLRGLAVPAANLPEDLRLLCRVGARILDQAPDRLPDIGQAVIRGHLLQKLHLG